MYLVTQTDCLIKSMGEESAIRMLAEAGFDAIDWSFFIYPVEDDCIWWTNDWKNHALHLKAVADKYNITFRQAHAPFPTSAGKEPYDTIVMDRIRRSMEISSMLGIKNIVVHPRQHLTYARNKQQLFTENVELYRSLIPLCEKLQIHVCAENMWQFDSKRGHIVDSVCASPEEFCAMLDAVDSPWIVGCLDIGHCALVGQDPADFIRAMGPDRLQALHVHDVDHKHDCHTMPFTQKLDWESICAALGEIGYTGELTFEADNTLAVFPNELLDTAASMMVHTGRYLISRVDAHRS